MKRANLIRGVRDVEGSILCGKVVNHASNSDLKESIIRNSDHSGTNERILSWAWKFQELEVTLDR